MDAAATVGSKNGPKVGSNQAFIVGVIKEKPGVFEYKGKRVHEAVVAIAAADLYSMPGAVSIQSSYPLGSRGDEVSVLVTVTGIPNSWTDKQSGEVKQSANVRLVAVE